MRSRCTLCRAVGISSAGSPRRRWTAACVSCAVVLVEGMSDQAALQTLAARLGRHLREEGVFIVPMGGATNIGHFLGLFGPRGFGVRLAGLCDEGEERDFRRSLEQAGLGAGLDRAGLDRRLTGGLDRAGLARLGFFVCVADLEDELIRSLGVRRVEQLIEAQGEFGPVPHLHQAARPAEPDPRAAVAPLHGHPLGPEDPLWPRARRGARSHPAA